MINPINLIGLADLQLRCAHRLNELYQPYLAQITSLELKTSIRYSLANPGKQLRPLLTYATGFTFDAPWDNLDLAAAAVELIHTYSLIHDDLPSMDNASLRRGKPTNHCVHGEALAILCGDALNTLSFQLLANGPAALSASKRIKMISLLSRAAGPAGMVDGQALDMTLLTDNTLSEAMLLTIYQLKTGRLFSAAIQLGWIASDDDDEFNEDALKQFSEKLGLAFQIQDDILDIEASSEKTGKPKNKDLENNKKTYPQVVGLTAAKEKVSSLYELALEDINYLGDKATLLRNLITEILCNKKPTSSRNDK